MHRIELAGQKMELATRDFSRLLGEIIGRVYLPFKHLHYSRVSGFPDLSDRAKASFLGEFELLRSLIPQIEDQKLRESLLSLELQTHKVEAFENRFVQVIAEFFDLPLPQTQRERLKLMRRANAYKSDWNPVWARQLEYQQLVKQSQQVFDKWEMIKIHVSEIGIQLSSESTEEDDVGRTPPESMEQLVRFLGWEEETADVRGIELGDQRAKEIIDKAIEEPDPQQAIRLLHEALIYGRTGIQASKAYLELGGRYGDMGNAAQAIRYYTKSIEAWEEPNAIAFFWRGELYHQQEQWAEAQEDFEKALSLGLWSPEREQAQRYLSAVGPGSNSGV